VKEQEMHARSSGANAVVRDGTASTADSSAYAGGGLSSLMGSSAGGVDFWRPEDQAFGEAAKEEGGVRFAFQLSGDRGCVHRTTSGRSLNSLHRLSVFSLLLSLLSSTCFPLL
jgi:hypothetical protein